MSVKEITSDLLEKLKPVFKEKIYEMLIDVIKELTPNIISQSQAIIRNHFSENVRNRSRL